MWILGFVWISTHVDIGFCVDIRTCGCWLLCGYAHMWILGWYEGAPWRQITTQGWVAVTYVGLFEMGITFVLWLNALKNTNNTARISNLIFASPFISLLLLATIIGEEIHPSTLMGLVLIIIGLVIQQIKFTKNLAQNETIDEFK